MWRYLHICKVICNGTKDTGGLEKLRFVLRSAQYRPTGDDRAARGHEPQLLSPPVSGTTGSWNVPSNTWLVLDTEYLIFENTIEYSTIEDHDDDGHGMISSIGNRIDMTKRLPWPRKSRCLSRSMRMTESISQNFPIDCWKTSHGLYIFKLGILDLICSKIISSRSAMSTD